jgi:putative CocE/NonD family hydrolase
MIILRASVVFAFVAIGLGAAELRIETFRVAMRDGVALATDVYRETAVARGPVVLVRTPYDRTKSRVVAEPVARAGYIVVVQDCRGAFASEGVLIPYNNEGQDGYDTVEWIVRQPWCSGRVGMMGGSYGGAVQWQAAVEHPPGLAAIAPRATWSSFHRNLHLGGAVRLSLIATWAAGNSARPAGAKPNGDWEAVLMHLPLSEIDDRIGWPIPWLEGMLTHPEPNGYWTRLDLTSRLPEVELPALHMVGYFDYFSRESVANFRIMQQSARNALVRNQQRLILGPWDHGSLERTTVGEVDFGPDAGIDTLALQIDWFDRHLREDPAARAKPFAPVRYFSMGDNVWREAPTWPPPGFAPTEFFLRSDGKANTRHGTGRLVREKPQRDEPADSFCADPARPVPACPLSNKRPLRFATWGPVDQRSLEDRDDVLVYTSDELNEPLTFAGHIEAKLHVSVDTPDADWAVKLVDVRPDGFAQNIATGILRGRYRNSLLRSEPMRPGEVYEITVDLGPCAATIAKGHRLRVDICGSLFPLYDRNPNTGEGPFGSGTAIATERVHHSPGALSRVILPCRLL